MIRNYFCIVVLGCLSFTLSAQTRNERLIWDKIPLSITLNVGQERLVTFPGNVRVGIPATLTGKLRTQSNNGTVYWLAKEAFTSQRIEIREIDTPRIYLIDLKADKQKQGFVNDPIEVIAQQQARKTDNPATTSGKRRRTRQSRPRQAGYVELTRFAAQQLYAPARIRSAAINIHRVPVIKKTTTFLIRNALIEATPVASWQSGRFYVTAVELVNTEARKILLDPRHIRGDWLTATFHHTVLYPAGTLEDTTVLYLISNRPYQEMI